MIVVYIGRSAQINNIMRTHAVCVIVIVLIPCYNDPTYMKLIFVRHGQTDFNKKGIVQGQEKDIPLNDDGRAQVEKTATTITKNVDRIISSPLARARETAEIINKRLHRGVEFSDELKEFSYGSLAGKTWAEIEKITGDPDIHAKDENVMFDHRPFGGESAQDVKARVKHFVDQVAATHSDETMVVTAHGGIIDTMHALYPQKERPSRDNASIHIFEL